MTSEATAAVMAPAAAPVAGNGFAVYDRPDLQDSISFPAPGGQREILLAAEGMHCGACVRRVEKLLAGQVSDLRISLTSRTLEFRFDPSRVRLSSLLARIDGGGFAPQVLAQDSGAREQVLARRRWLARIGVAVLCAMQIMMLAWPSYVDRGVIDPGIDQLLRWAQLAVATPAVFYAGWPFWRGAALALRGRSVNMDVPVALSIGIAYSASLARTVLGHGEIYFDAATMFVLFLLVGRFVESRTRAQAGERLRLLAGRRRLTAQREGSRGIETVPLAQIAVGDIVVVAPGESVPVDGELLDERAECDEALLTGESQAVLHDRGERLLAGSLNLGQQPLRLQAAGVGAQTRLAQIAHLLQRAQTERPRFQLIADRLAGVFVLAIIALSAIGALVWWHAGLDRSLSVALAVLVASCPCALSLAMPAAMAAASSRLAAAGVLAARPEALARLPKIDTVLFDKTGTLTRSALQVARITAVGDRDAQHCLEIAAALERGLTHPIAQAFAGIETALIANDQRQVPGQGVSGRIDGRAYRLQAAVEASGSGETLLTLSGDDGPVAQLALTATLRPDAPQAVAALQAEGIDVRLLTGDAEAPARVLAAMLGIDRVQARQSPEDKLTRLRELQRDGHVVLAVGDGINDAPLLAAADVSAVMPQGAAMAQSRADLLLVGDSLTALATARSLARQAERRVRENLLWAVGYNLAVLPLALGGILLPWMAALGMSISSLVVVGNALRLRRPAAPGAEPASVPEPRMEVC